MEPGPLRDLLTLLLGLVTGILSALFGIGGAIVSNPGLRALGAAPLVAVGTTLPSILPGAVSGTLRYQREHLIAWPVVIAAAVAGLPAVVGGSLLSHELPGDGHLLLLIIAVLLAFTAWRTAATRPSTPEPAQPTDNPEPTGAVDTREPPTRPSATLPLRGTSHPEAADAHARRASEPVPADPGAHRTRARWVAAGIGLVAGLLSGLLGIGGGVIMVPAFTELLHMQLKSAIASSLVCVGIFGVPATIAHALLGDIDWRMGALLAVAVIPGARIGANITIRTGERRLRLAVGWFLAVVAVVYFVTETRALLEEL
jgi:uncharacterized membrane protein YfcA